jgi:positive regulator of sigma E activity
MLHGDEMNIIYFWSSILMVALPIAAFTWLTWLVVKAYRKEHGARSREQKAEHLT